MDKLIELHRPVYPSEIVIKGTKSNSHVPAALKELTDRGFVAQAEDSAIMGVYPVSALPTPHKIQLADGRTIYAMCAIDALGMVYVIDKNLSISSSCKHCDTNISIEAENGGFSTIKPHTIHALYVDIEKYKDWASAC